MRLSTGFWSFKTFAAALELSLFTRLAEGRTMSATEVSAELGLPHRPADLLLAACASLGLLEKRGDGYGNTALAEMFLVEGRPYYFGGFVRYCDKREYPAWDRVVEALRTDKPTAWDPEAQDSPFAAEDSQMLQLFWDAMHCISTFTARALGEVYDFGKHARLLDVGGGSGAFPIELCRHYPNLSATVYDLPHVCSIADSKIAGAGLSGRITTVAGDFLCDTELPTGHDVILYSMIMHDWGEDTNRELLARAYEALAPGGVVIISELVLNAERTGPAEAALMGMNMLIETRAGKNYSETEYVTWLQDAKFCDIRTLPFVAAGANGVIIGVKERPINQVARELGMSHETQRNWVHAAERQTGPGSAASGSGFSVADKDAEIARLLREVAELRQEKEILRTAAAYFAKEMDR
ncbi:methyltransferase [Micromonospora sp. NPDC048830]|uniref:methyltransferase n=1 Tax=Micromonospora sp. NPDC048830 TaxID=3364257 RepID=UPI00371D777C